MEKLKLQTKNGVSENIERLAELFPNCVTETYDANGNVKLAVDFDILRQELNDTIVEGKDERYQFVWPDKKKAILDDGSVKLISHFFNDVQGVIDYIHGTGLDEVLQNKQVKNLVDYVFGVETGLDTNARKNRSGHLMESQVANILDKSNVEYRQEVYSTEYPELAVLGEDKKRFDFVIETSRCNYLIEVNFYSGGGSKLNEVARAYSELSPKINAVDGFEFVWITDGIGWKSARNKLEEAFYAIPNVYNLTTISQFIEQIKEELQNG